MSTLAKVAEPNWRGWMLAAEAAKGTSRVVKRILIGALLQMLQYYSRREAVMVVNTMVLKISTNAFISHTYSLGKWTLVDRLNICSVLETIAVVF